jgi:hypothetical protein
MIERLHDSIWTLRRPFRYLGAEIGGRMTILKLRDGGLFVHSPVQLDASSKAEIDAIGPVRFIVAPNRFHHLYAGELARDFPRAKLHGAPGLDAKRKDLKFAAILDDIAPKEWADEIDQVVFRAFSPLNEVIFFHRPSRTVIFTDLLFNITKSDSSFTRLLLKLDGGLGSVAVRRSFRLAI